MGKDGGVVVVGAGGKNVVCDCSGGFPSPPLPQIVMTTTVCRVFHMSR